LQDLEAKKRAEEDRRKRDEDKKRAQEGDELKRREEEKKTTESSYPPCAGCSRPIESAGLQALNKKWHKDCFVCNSCNKPFTSSFMHKDGMPYCTEDFQKLFSKKCAGCGNVIEGQFIRAVNQEWHVNGCFVCCKCKGALTAGFIERDGHPYCKNCT